MRLRARRAGMKGRMALYRAAVVALLLPWCVVSAAGRKVEERGKFKINFEKFGNDQVAVRLDVSGQFESNKDANLAGALVAVRVGGVEFRGTADEKTRVKTGYMKAGLVEDGRALQIEIRKTALLTDTSDFQSFPRETGKEPRNVLIPVQVTAEKDGSTTVLYYSAGLPFAYKANGRSGAGRMR